MVGIFIKRHHVTEIGILELNSCEFSIFPSNEAFIGPYPESAITGFKHWYDCIARQSVFCCETLEMSMAHLDQPGMLCSNPHRPGVILLDRIDIVARHSPTETLNARLRKACDNTSIGAYPDIAVLIHKHRRDKVLSRNFAEEVVGQLSIFPSL